MSVIKQITVVFNPLETILENEFLDIFVTVGATTATYRETFVAQRIQGRQVSIGASASENASNYANGMILDGTRVGIIATVFENSAILTLTDPTYYFETPTGNIITNNRATISTTIGDEVFLKTVAINSYTAKTPFCTDINVILGVTGGSELYDVYVNNVLVLEDKETPITVPLLRGQVDSIRVVDSLNETIGTITSTNPRKLITSDITTSVLNLSSGTTLTISVAFISPYVSPYEYSLDGTTYQESNVFTGLTPDTYTVYVRDALGCSISTSIVIDGFTQVTDTIFSISDINPIQFVKYEQGKKNYKNTLSCNELRLMPYKYIQQFLAEDIVSTQFKTNAQYINIYAFDSYLNVTTLTPIKRTSNIGLQAKSTCTYFNLGDGKSGIYFGVVDLLDPVTDVVTGNADFGFTLPVWANTEGKYVTIDDIGEVEVKRTGYSDTYQSFILEFDIAYTGEPIETALSSVYNLQPYEIYEFNANIGTLPESFNIVIEVGKSDEEINFTYISEKVQRVDDNDFLFKIEYYDDKNRGNFVYQTGVKNKIRMQGLVTYLGEQTTEGYDGDKEFYVTDNTVYHSERFSFFRLPTNIAHKMRQIVTHSSLFVNGISYKLAEKPEISDSDGNTNFKNFFVTLKSGSNVVLDEQSEIITGTSQSLELQSNIDASQGKAPLLWTINL